MLSIVFVFFYNATKGIVQQAVNVSHDEASWERWKQHFIRLWQYLSPDGISCVFFNNSSSYLSGWQQAECQTWEHFDWCMMGTGPSGCHIVSEQTSSLTLVWNYAQQRDKKYLLGSCNSWTFWTYILCSHAWKVCFFEIRASVSQHFTS